MQKKSLCMINDHKRSEYQCQSTLIWTWLGEENYGNKRSYSEVQVGQKSLCTLKIRSLHNINNYISRQNHKETMKSAV